MARMIAGVLVGYIVMFAAVFTTFTAAFFAMGSDKAFQPQSYDVTGLWLVVSFLLGLIAAIAGGFVCAAIAKREKAAMVLGGLVLVLGLVMAIPALTATPEKPVRGGDVSNFEAMTKAQTPGWVALLNAPIGAVGAVVGGRLRKKDGEM